MSTLVDTDSKLTLDFRASVACLIADHDDAGRAARFLECRQPGSMFYGFCDDCDDVKTLSPCSCDLRICPECAEARAADLAAQLRPALDQLSRQLRRPAYQLRHVVLTTSVQLSQDVDDLRRLCRRLRTAARVLFQQMFPDDKHLGGLIGMEFGESGQRLHFHCLVACRWIDKHRLTDDWQRLSGGLGYITHVRKVDDVKSGLAEVTKYITKPLAVDEQSAGAALTLFTIHQLLRGMRRFTSFGTMYRMERADTDTYGLCPDCGQVLTWMPLWQYEAWQKHAHLDLISADKSIAEIPPRSPPQPAFPGFEPITPDTNAIRL